MSSQQPAHGDVYQQLEKQNIRKVHVPDNRKKKLKNDWAELIKPLTKNMEIAVKYDLKSSSINLVPSWIVKKAPIPSNEVQALHESRLTKAVEYLNAYICGFKPSDCLSILRLDEIFLQTFKITDVKKLEKKHLSRAIGRISGTKGRTKHAIENATKTRIIINDKTIHLLGSHENICLARDSICSLILGSQPTKVHNHLSVVNRRMKERF